MDITFWILMIIAQYNAQWEAGWRYDPFTHTWSAPVAQPAARQESTGRARVLREAQ